ncbi:hypothetical protein QFZ35_001232 [Arthrobacter ulcerisalmonis]|uniref:hypothetical protein n=1 Tax=Arthrobacter sp. B1I2 TaxID=3042263 RepID=UPI002782EAF3|nr:MULTISPECIES: hypothetical protein [Arthrobacter]MDQ0662734.1 hypothetical protein [Arthrobacter ulcerisalmonis]MDQ0730625.1 hypothetical protein [Arthrobacter sp. B1I2]
MNSQATLEAPRDATDLNREQDGQGGASKKVLGLRADWARLPGRSVEVWLHGEHVASGVVDQAAEDGSVLWIAAEGISTRRIFDKSSGYQIWV